VSGIPPLKMLLKLCFCIICIIIIVVVCVFFHIFLKEYLNDIIKYDSRLYNKLLSVKSKII